MEPTAAVDPVCGKTLETWDRGLDRPYATTVYHFCSAACCRRFSDDPAAFAPPIPVHSSSRERVTLPILGLTCGGGGALSVERALQRLQGVIRVYVNAATEMAYVEYWPRQVAVGEIIRAVEGSGYRTGRNEQRH